MTLVNLVHASGFQGNAPGGLVLFIHADVIAGCAHRKWSAVAPGIGGSGKMWVAATFFGGLGC